jgi:hypothetical protein
MLASHLLYKLRPGDAFTGGGAEKRQKNCEPRCSQLGCAAEVPLQYQAVKGTQNFYLVRISPNKKIKLIQI